MASPSSCLPLGYLGDMIKGYFLSYADRHADFTVDTRRGLSSATTARPKTGA